MFTCLAQMMLRGERTNATHSLKESFFSSFFFFFLLSAFSSVRLFEIEVAEIRQLFESLDANDLGWNTMMRLSGNAYTEVKKVNEM